MKDYCEGCNYELKESEHQYCERCSEALEDMIAAQHRDWLRSRVVARFQDYEPEQAYGTHYDIKEHIRYGGTRENY